MSDFTDKVTAWDACTAAYDRGYAAALSSHHHPHPHPVETVQADVQPSLVRWKRFDYSITNERMIETVNGFFTLHSEAQATIAALEARIVSLDEVLTETAKRCTEMTLERDRANAAIAQSQREKEGLREALTPFARISTEGIAKLTTNYTEVRMLSDYFHTAARVLSAIKKEKV